MNSIINIKNFTKNFKSETVLNDINLSIKKGKCYGFIGTNGSGKTLLFKSICGFIKASSGYIEVRGSKIGSDIDFPQNTGIIIETPGFIPYLSGFENLKLLASINNKINDKDILETLNLLELSNYKNKAVKKYSLGMKQRLAIAQALMEKPSLLILDEPMNGLDESGTTLVRNILSKEKNNGTTILLSSHNKEDIAILCDKVYEIKNGTLNNESV